MLTKDVKNVRPCPPPYRGGDLPVYWAMGTIVALMGTVALACKFHIMAWWVGGVFEAALITAALSCLTWIAENTYTEE